MNFKITCKKSWPMDLLQVSNLSFDPCFKVKWGHHTKMAIYISSIGPWGGSSHREQIKYSKFSPFLHYMNCMKGLVSGNIIWALYTSSAEVVS